MMKLIPGTYKMRDNITVHSQIKPHVIEGDAVSGTITSYGFGTVLKYTPTVMAADPDPPLEIANMGLLSWLKLD